MPIDVTADTSFEIHHDLQPGDSRFGYLVPVPVRVAGSNTTLPAVRVWRIDGTVTPIPRTKLCRYRLTRIDMMVHCAIHLNDDKVRRGFMDPTTDPPRGYVGQEQNGQPVPGAPDHLKLDEQSVLTHERSHARDIADAVEAAVEAGLASFADDLFVDRVCSPEYRGWYDLMDMVVRRVQSIGSDAWDALADEASRHGENSETEHRARRTQVEDLRNR